MLSHQCDMQLFNVKLYIYVTIVFQITILKMKQYTHRWQLDNINGFVCNFMQGVKLEHRPAQYLPTHDLASAPRE